MNELVAAVPPGWPGRNSHRRALAEVILVRHRRACSSPGSSAAAGCILDFALLYSDAGARPQPGGRLRQPAARPRLHIAFYAVGAYTFAFLASPHFDVHLLVLGHPAAVPPSPRSPA